MWRSRLWSISWLRHQMFYPYAAQASESDDLHNVMSLFSLFLSSFTSAKDLERPWRIAAVNPPKRGKRRSICGLLCDETGLQMLLSRMQTLNWDTAKVQNITDLIHCQRESIVWCNEFYYFYKMSIIILIFTSRLKTQQFVTSRHSDTFEVDLMNFHRRLTCSSQ